MSAETLVEAPSMVPDDAVEPAEPEASRSETILQAVSLAAECLLRPTLAEDTVSIALGLLGEGTGASRVFVVENIRDDADGDLRMRQRWEWAACGVIPHAELGSFWNRRYAPALGQWQARLSLGDELIRDPSSWSPEECKLLDISSQHAMVLVPIQVEGAWWGFIGFDALEREQAWSEAEAGALRAAAGILGAAIGRAAAEEEVRFAASVYENSIEGIVITDAEGKILRVNPAFTRVTGYQSHEVIGKTPKLLNSGRHDQAFYQDMWSSLTETGSWRGEIWNRRRNGELYPQWLGISAVRDADGRVNHYIGVFNDITDKKLSEKRIQRLAYYDPLTELPNRRLFQDRLQQALMNSQRTDSEVALLYLDLDRFKLVNDSFGHTTGDELLKEAARRLRSCVRASDTVARLGGDEFTIILAGLSADRHVPEQVAVLAQNIIDTLSEPYQFDGQDVTVSASVGIAVHPQDGDDGETLTLNADTAMYHAKAAGRKNHQFYTQEMNARARERLQIENQLRRALDKGELEIHYQPQVDLASGRVAGLEALLRWRPDGRQLISPVEFIPLAEETGLIVPIGAWVCKQACRQLAAWSADGLGQFRVAVNISPEQFRQPGLADMVHDALVDSGIPPGRLELEITESSLMGDERHIMETLGVLKELGVTVALDDFGTGYSSLSYLKRFSLDALKIDRSFVHGIPSDAETTSITEAIIVMARKLNLRVVSEGVENAEQLSFLRQHDCDEVQGFLLGRPMPVREFGDRLRQVFGA
jgi:diguanylate cyclase (GGDEF)-like protein/PAS domain S-box-containing protein